MNQAEYNQITAKLARGKEAVVKQTIKNKAGNTIEAGENVIISGKSGKDGFYITSKFNGIHISHVHFSLIDLVQKG